MTSTVRNLCASAELTLAGVVSWGEKPSLDGAGVYLVSTSEDPDAKPMTDQPLISQSAVQELLATRPELHLDGSRPTAEQLVARLVSMWVPAESVLYVGLAGTSVCRRVCAYFRTPLGARSPHAGGWPLKTLATLPSLYVHYARAHDPAEAEERLVSAFVDAVGVDAAASTTDPSLPLPFANLRSPQGRAKRHGITGARAPREPSAAQAAALPASAPSAHVVRTEPRSGTFPLNVTGADIRAGQVRVTREPKRVLGFSTERCTVNITLRGHALLVPWDPRLAADVERSGLLRIGRDAAATLIGEPRQLTIRSSGDGTFTLD